MSWLRRRSCAKAYRRGQLDTLASIRLLLDPQDTRLRAEIDERLTRLSGTPPA